VSVLTNKVVYIKHSVTTRQMFTSGWFWDGVRRRCSLLPYTHT